MLCVPFPLAIHQNGFYGGRTALLPSPSTETPFLVDETPISGREGSEVGRQGDSVRPPSASCTPAPPTIYFVPLNAELVSCGPLPLYLSGGGQAPRHPTLLPSNLIQKDGFSKNAYALQPMTIHVWGPLPGQSPYENPDYPHQRLFSRTIAFLNQGPSMLEAVFPDGHLSKPGTIHAGGRFPGRSPFKTGDHPRWRAFFRTINVWVRDEAGWCHPAPGLSGPAGQGRVVDGCGSA